jgi:hypothetical protein
MIKIAMIIAMKALIRIAYVGVVVVFVVFVAVKLTQFPLPSFLNPVLQDSQP